jgi:dTDP-4-amino-4,6-dideoxygalactose transaminase
MTGLDYLVTEDICRRCLSLPMHPYLENVTVKNICGKLKEILQ